MKKLVKGMEVLPQFILAGYISLYFKINTEHYAQIYDTVVIADNLLVTCMVGAYLAGGHRSWNWIALKSFTTVIVLNIITELNRALEFAGYYDLYLNLLNVFFITLFIFYCPKTTTKDAG